MNGLHCDDCSGEYDHRLSLAFQQLSVRFSIINCRHISGAINANERYSTTRMRLVQ
jgi:hypothetical protein